MFQASVTVYSLINSEDWHTTLYYLVRAARANGSNEIVPKIYCMLALIIGNFTLLALFTGTLLQGFQNRIEENQLVEQD